MDHVSTSRRSAVAARRWPLWDVIGLLAGLLMLLVSCSSGGDSGQVAPPTEPSPALQQHTVADLLTLYRTAFVQQDIDRLDALLQRDLSLAQASARLLASARSPVL